MTHLQGLLSLVDDREGDEDGSVCPHHLRFHLCLHPFLVQLKPVHLAQRLQLFQLVQVLLQQS